MLQSSAYYFINLQLPRAIDNMRYQFRDKPIIYGIRCRVTGKMYIGSTFVPQDRFYKHLIARDPLRSSPELQDDITRYGLESITVHIFEVVKFPKDMHIANRKDHLRSIEQSYLDRWPKHKRYNANASYTW